MLIRSEKAEKELRDIVSGSALVRNSSSSCTCCLVSSCLRASRSLTRRVLSSTNWGQAVREGKGQAVREGKGRGRQ